uniref:Late nodulin n=1 Tax=Caenorhabditis tropicalis TaxID=1561998 RepID=A0A1I7THK2_9PELO
MTNWLRQHFDPRVSQRKSSDSSAALFVMKLLIILLIALIAISTPVLARGRRCRSSTQCDYESVCYEGYCYTIDEMFDKFDV